MAIVKPDLRVFLDANVLFSAAYREQAGLAVLWNLRQVRLLTSLYAAQEAANNLREHDQQRRLNDLLGHVALISSVSVAENVFKIQLPDKDRPILAAAIEGKADFLLTGDIKHFGMYFNQTIYGVHIARPAEFLKIFAERQHRRG